MTHAHLPLGFGVRLPYAALRQDPQLRIRWTIRDSDDNSILLNADDWAKANASVVLSSFGRASHLTVTCRVYLVLGAMTIDLCADWVYVDLLERLDRHKPYVQWCHWVVTPDFVAESGVLTQRGTTAKYRESRIHRTDLEGRCRSVGSYSITEIKTVPVPSDPPTKIVYFESLPFPRERLAEHRHTVCEYCFFGGPGHTQAKP